jgi:glycosyltransferase involved in cell wall biosynthesis
MKVNIITNFQANTGLSHDSNILRGILTAVYGDDIQIFRIPYVFPQCAEADVNIFLEVVNPSLFSYARKNIWIPNQEWTYQTWIPYITMFDEIWVKTIEARKCFNDASQYKANIKYIGWSSIDKGWNPDTIKKNYSKAIVPVGKNIFRNPKPIFQAYMRLKATDPTTYSKLPVLYVVYSPANINVFVPSDISDKVVLHGEVLAQDEYDNLLKECGLCICTSAAEGFGHAIVEAMSVGCNLILSPISPFVHDIIGEIQPGVYYCEMSETAKQTECIGVLVDTSISSIMKNLTFYVNTPIKTKQESSAFVRDLYEAHHKEWINQIKTVLTESLNTNLPAYSLNDVFPKEEKLPDVSILTITKDRRSFMPLAKYSYMIQSYPEDKLEWVIIDDGDDPIEDTLIGVPNVKYVKCAPGMTISQKRNLAVENAMYDIMVTMDDDDVYPNNSVLQRVAMLLKEPVKQCGFCTTIPCYDITKFSSFMNVPPMTLTMSERVSEATLVFTRQFWNEGKFDEKVHIGEGSAFIRGREQMCREISPQDVIVSLIHPKNTSSRKTPILKEPNGCHYGFNEQLFAMVTQIGEELSQSSDQKV